METDQKVVNDDQGRRFKKQLEVLMPAIVGLIGVIVGSAVSGWVQFKASQLSFEKERMVEAGKASRELGDELLKSATAYFSSQFTMATLSEAELADEKFVVQFRQTQAEGLKLSLVTSLPTSRKVLDCNVKSAHLLSVPEGPERIKARKALEQSIGQAFIAVYFDLAKYRWRASPDSRSDEVIYSLFQIFGENAGGNEAPKAGAGDEKDSQ